MLSLNKNEKTVATTDKQSLDKYLTGAVVLMSGKSKADAEKSPRITFARPIAKISANPPSMRKLPN